MGFIGLDKARRAMEPSMKYAIAIVFAMIGFSAHAQIVPPVTSNKSPPVDFSLAVKDPVGIPFPVTMTNGAICETISPACPQLTWTLKFASYLSLVSPTPKQGGATPEDQTNVALGFKIWGSTAPVYLSTNDRVALRKSLMRGVIGSMAIDYAACLMIDTAEACEGK